MTLSGQTRLHLRQVICEAVVVVYKHHRPLRFSIRCSKAFEGLGSEHMSSSFVSQSTLSCMDKKAPFGSPIRRGQRCNSSLWNKVSFIHRNEGR